MAESIVQVTEGSGKKLHTFQRTIGANVVEDEIVQIGEQYLPTYTVVTASTSAATSTSHLIQVMAGASLNLYIRRVWVYQAALITTAAIVPFTFQRLTTAGTGGTVVTPAPLDSLDPASGATAMTLPTAKGTEGNTLGPVVDAIPVQTAPTSGALVLLAYWDFSQSLRGKSARIPAGAANGCMVSNRAAAAGLSVHVAVEFAEANF
jgi:hypothetical protein